MVDFQSRDRRRDAHVSGVDDEDEDVTADESAAGDDETTDEEARAEYGPETFPFAVVAVTDDRTMEEDATGDIVVDAIESAGDAVATRELVAASYDGVQSTLTTLVARADVDAVVTVGGTGVEPDDVTVDAAEHLFDKHLPGFGELFRVLSHEQEGTATVRTRTTAGIVDEVPVFCLPGDTVAARRGVEQLVLEEAETLAEQAATEDTE
ncbi:MULTISPECIES: MogA/MoaB family molybdenum cofactor biosynthesis protein [Salinibaculum]|uniref:MogA/MoaB family molybdenum cofactor biosynthesis protein n=1 Tax=Salinibaculum TaxID=2732368 RepID=UPI0030D58481